MNANSKQDLNGVRSVQDLERKYDFASILGLKKNVKMQIEQLTKINNELNKFISTTTKQIRELNTQLDGKIETFFYSGPPTLNNVPASNWEEKTYDTHLGDLYYDIDTGYSYRFALQNSTYLWIKIVDSDVTEALKLASNAKDTADGKRRIFTEQPTPPYDKGDLYFKDKDIYICDVSKTTGIFEIDDFVIATKYTDDTNLNNFIDVTYNKAMENLTNQIDGKISTWYYSGVPTLDNAPANEWSLDEKMMHTGDIYYDKSTGYCYVFEYSSEVFKWTRIKDKDIVEAMSLAGSAKDTADSKRQVFITQPVPPYSCGDLWISSNEIYICQIERLNGDFVSGDWINNLKYTDNTYAQAIVDELGGTTTKVLEGTVTQYTKSWVKFTDLATGGSTSINGANIDTGNINTDNVSIGNGNVTINKSGILLNNGAKIVGEYGMITNLQFNSFGISELWSDTKKAGEYNMLGFMDSDITGKDKYNIYIDVIIPENFKITSAYITLRHIASTTTMLDGTNVYGYARNIKCYIGKVEGNICVPGYESSEYLPQLNGISFSEISKCFNTSNNNFTPTAPTSSNYNVKEITTNNIASQLMKKSRIKIATTNSTPSTSKACLEQTGFVFAQLNVYGYMSYE